MGPERYLQNRLDHTDTASHPHLVTSPESTLSLEKTIDTDKSQQATTPDFSERYGRPFPELSPEGKMQRLKWQGIDLMDVNSPSLPEDTDNPSTSFELMDPDEQASETRQKVQNLVLSGSKDDIATLQQITTATVMLDALDIRTQPDIFRHFKITQEQAPSNKENFQDTEGMNNPPKTTVLLDARELDFSNQKGSDHSSAYINLLSQVAHFAQNQSWRQREETLDVMRKQKDAVDSRLNIVPVKYIEENGGHTVRLK